MSMLDLFRRNKSSYALLDRSASCATMSAMHPQDDDGVHAPVSGLKRCATTVARPTAKSGWGIVPVLNELERRSSTNTLLHRRSPAAQQLLCLNCRRLYFTSESQCTPQTAPRASPRASAAVSVALHDQFCSLDCRSSYECSASTQNLVDLELGAHSATSSDEDAAVITLDDDAEFSF